MKKREVLFEILSWVKTLGIAFIIAFLATRFVIVNAVVPSGSMENTIHPGDRLFGSRLTYLLHEPERGDIVIFKYPVNEKLIETLKSETGKKYLEENDISHINYVKRLIGLPGEIVEIREGKIYINGSDEPIDEPYLKEEWEYENDGYVFQIPEDCYLMLGDNRNNSEDSRYWADNARLCFEEAGEEVSADEIEKLSYVKKDQLVGKAYLKYWPLTSMSVLH